MEGVAQSPVVAGTEMEMGQTNTHKTHKTVRCAQLFKQRKHWSPLFLQRSTAESDIKPDYLRSARIINSRFRTQTNLILSTLRRKDQIHAFWHLKKVRVCPFHSSSNPSRNSSSQYWSTIWLVFTLDENKDENKDETNRCRVLAVSVGLACFIQGRWVISIW
jgi:hypothetical protein